MEQRENKMGVMPVGKLILNMSLPIMLSMLVMALYNVVDSIFVAMISEQALTAVSAAFPIQNLMIAVSTGTGVGLNALISKSLGEKKFYEASTLAKNGIFLAVCSYIVFLIVGIFLVRPFFASQTANPEIIEQGVQYATIVSVLSFGVFGQIAFERIMQSTGKTIYTMITQIVGAVINMVFDPIFIFVFKLGVAGAAYATVLGQIIAMFVAIWLNHHYNHEIKLDFRGFRPSGKHIRKIYAIGVPSIIMASIGSVMYYGVNKILMAMNETAGAVFGVYFKLQSFVFMPVFGLNNGIIPIIGYNYGAGNRKRIMKAYRLGLLYAIVVMTLGFLLFQFATPWLLGIFSASEQMLLIGIPALKIISCCFIFAAVGIVTSSLFQAFGRGVASMITSIARQLVVLLPAAYLLSLSGNVDHVWWSFPIAEGASLALILILFANIYNKTIKHIPDGRE